jgi:hypothetical protein
VVPGFEIMGTRDKLLIPHRYTRRGPQFPPLQRVEGTTIFFFSRSISLPGGSLLRLWGFRGGDQGTREDVAVLALGDPP